MSYPYDINPWDDNYSTNTSQGQNAQSGYGGYPADSYSNQPIQGRQYDDEDEQNRVDEQQRQAGAQQQSQGPRPFIVRFLSCLGYCWNLVPPRAKVVTTMSGINLPFIDALVQHINRDLLVSKIFYFFFYSAFGSLFPLMGVYFKQLGMNPAQVGILTGVRPFIEIFSAPFWNSLAERFHKSKALLLFSLLSWIIFTYSLAHIRPPASACVAYNDTNYVLYTPYSANDLANFVGQLEEGGGESNPENEMFMTKVPSTAENSSKDKEGKDEILASEENQNDQRRKRRKRQIDEEHQIEPSKKQLDSSNKNVRKEYIYTIDSGGKEDSYESHLDLNIDFESDFDDKLTGQDNSARVVNHRSGSSYVELDDVNEDDSEFDDELEHQQLHLKGALRYKRSASIKDVDDSLGDDQEDGSEEEKKVKERLREKEEDEEDELEGEDGINNNIGSGSDRGSSSGSGRSGSGANTLPGTSNKKDRGSTKYNQQSGGTTTTTTSTTTTTELSYDPAYKEKGSSGAVSKTKRVYKQRHKTPPTHIVGMSPITVEYTVNYSKEKHSQLVTPMFSTIVYKLDDIKEVFFLLLLLISLGEFFSAPALTLADSATLSYLGDNTDLYGRQRMFGSFSWAITLLLVGMALDNATSIADHPCGPHQRERSYTVCFIIFSLLMACALLTATQFRFNYPKSTSGGSQALIASTTDSNTVVTTTVDGSVGTGNIDELYASTQPRSIFNTAPPVNAPLNAQHRGKEKFEFLDKWKSAVFAQRTWEVPEWVNVFRQFRNSLHLTYLFITWFLGCGVGLVFTFLFWHLQDVGGTPTLFGICSVINHISEILAYFFSFSFIKRFGHTRVSMLIMQLGGDDRNDNKEF